MGNNLQNFLAPQPQQPGAPNYPLPNAFSNQPPQFFPQPIGNVYNLNSANDINNIPMGQGISVGISLSEGIAYIKSFQNGSPMVLGYKLAPLDLGEKKEEPQNNLSDVLSGYEQRFERIDAYLKKISEKLGGSKFEWQ